MTKADRDRNPYLPQETGEDDEVEILEVVGLDEPPGPEFGPLAGGRDAEACPDDELLLALDDEGEEEEEHEEALGRTPPPAEPPRGAAAARVSGTTAESDAAVVQLRADYDNLAKRMARDREEYHYRASSALVGRLLPVLDNFERAITVIPKDRIDRAFQEGVVMIYRQLTDELAREGLRPIDAVGQPFDPSVHDAVATDTDSTHPPNTVVEEFLRGYLFRSHVLRPARVKVSVSSGDGEGEVS